MYGRLAVTVQQLTQNQDTGSGIKFRLDTCVNTYVLFFGDEHKTEIVKVEIYQQIMLMFLENVC